MKSTPELYIERSQKLDVINATKETILRNFIEKNTDETNDAFVKLLESGQALGLYHYCITSCANYNADSVLKNLSAWPHKPPSVSFLLGVILWNPFSKIQDPDVSKKERARYYMGKAANDGIAAAQEYMGAYFSENLNEKLDWYKKAYKNNSIRVCFDLAITYTENENLTDSHSEICRWFMEAIERCGSDVANQAGWLQGMVINRLFEYIEKYPEAKEALIETITESYPKSASPLSKEVLDFHAKHQPFFEIARGREDGRDIIEKTERVIQTQQRSVASDTALTLTSSAIPSPKASWGAEVGDSVKKR
jgi:hypothetical protein